MKAITSTQYTSIASRIKHIVLYVLCAFVTTTCTATAYDDVLYIPPLVEPLVENTSKIFNLTAEDGTHAFSEGKKAKTLYYADGNTINKTAKRNVVNYLGPTLHFRNKDNIELRITNNINQVTTFHQHGLHLPAESDGSPYQKIEVGDTWVSKFTVKQVAGTFWYHPHQIELTGYQVTKGMAGLIIVDDDASNALALPKTYGVDDIPLIVQDKKIENNKIQYSDRNMHMQMMGNIGKTVLTNGSVTPKFEANRSLLRFRILNGSSYGIQTLYFSDNRDFYLIANDAGLLEAPVKIQSLLLAPSERREILVDIQDLSLEDTISLMANIHSVYNARVLTISAKNFVAGNTAIPSALVDVQNLDSSEVSNRRTFSLESINPNSSGGLGMGMFGNRNSRLTINGKSMDMNRIDETIKINSTEIWTINNLAQQGMMANLPHSFHPHHGSFQVISFNNSATPPELKGWKDTLLLLPGDSAKIIMRFEDYTGTYMYHCHQLEHEDAGMMGTFAVVN